MIVFSVNDLKSFEEAQEFREQIVKIRQDETIPFILVGNKVDLEERQVTVGQALAKATDWHVWYMETSAKTRENVCKVFINVMNKMIEKQRIQAIPVDDKEEEDAEEEEEDSEEEQDEPGFDLFEKTVVGPGGGKFKKYMKVQTLSDGSKVKTILEPDDPILDEYEIKKQHLATGKRTFKTKPSPTAKLALRRRPMLSDDDNDNNDRPGPAKKPRNDRGDRNNGRNDRNNGRPDTCSTPGQKGPMIEEVTEMIGTMTEEMVVTSVNSIIVTFVIKNSRVPKIWRITIELSIHLHLHPKIYDKSWVPNGSGQKRAKIKVEQKFGGDDKKKKIVVAKTFLTAITAISHSIEY